MRFWCPEKSAVNGNIFDALDRNLRGISCNCPFLTFLVIDPQFSQLFRSKCAQILESFATRWPSSIHSQDSCNRSTNTQGIITNHPWECSKSNFHVYNHRNRMTTQSVHSFLQCEFDVSEINTTETSWSRLQDTYKTMPKNDNTICSVNPLLSRINDSDRNALNPRRETNDRLHRICDLHIQMTATHLHQAYSLVRRQIQRQNRRLSMTQECHATRTRASRRRRESMCATNRK